MRLLGRFILGRSLVREMLPTLLLASGVATFLLLIRQLFILADLFISHSVTATDGFRLLLLALPHMAVLTIPMGALFAVLMTSGRLSADSELIALQACGVRLWRVARPLLLAAVGLFALDLWLTTLVMPAANQAFEELRMKLALSGAKPSIEPRIFIEDFPGKWLYVERVDRKSGRWHGVLLFDESIAGEERLVVADSGELLSDPNDGTVWLDLRDAVIHVVQPDQPEKYKQNPNRQLRVRLTPVSSGGGAKVRFGVRATTTADLLSRIGDPTSSEDDRHEALVELHKRIAIPAAALVFVLIGFPLGVRNRRGGRSYGLTASVALVVAYYVLLNNGELLARSRGVPVALGIWLPNLLLAVAGLLMLRRASRGVSRTGAPGEAWWNRLPLLRRAPSVRSPLVVAAASRRHAGEGRVVGPGGERHGEEARPAAAAPAEEGSPGPRARRDRRSIAPPFVAVVDRYLLRLCLGFFALVIVTVCAIYIVVNLSERIDDIQKYAVPLIMVASYYFFSLPQMLHDMLPLAFLIAFLGAGAVLDRHNETTAIKAAGVSLFRLALPLLLLACALGIGLFVLDESVVERANRVSQRLEDVLKGNRVARAYRATDQSWVFLPNGRTLVNFLQYDPDTRTLLRPSVYVFDDSLNLRSRYMAESATYDAGRWHAKGAWERTFLADGTAQFVPPGNNVELPLSVQPDYFGREFHSPSQMSLGELRDYIRTLRAAGYRADRQVVELNQKIAYPLSIVVLAWLALPFAFRLGRHGTVMGIAVALVLGMAYFAVTAFVTKLGEAGLLPPVAAAWTPTVVFTLLAINRQTSIRT